MRFVKISHFYVDGVESKKCSKCHEIKELDDFGKRRTAADGLTYLCKSCKKEEQKKYIKTDSYKRSQKKSQDKYRKNNKNKAREYRRKYKETEKGREYIKKYKHSRRSRDKGLIYTLTPNDWRECVEYFGGSCAYCGDTKGKLEQEHIVPSSKGGHYTKQNIIPACRQCNLGKLDKDMVSWYTSHKDFDEKRFDKIVEWSNLNIDGDNQQISFL